MFILHHIQIISTLLTQAARQKPAVLPVVLIRKRSADALLTTPCILFKISLILFLLVLTPIFLNTGRIEQEHLSHVHYLRLCQLCLYQKVILVTVFRIKSWSSYKSSSLLVKFHTMNTRCIWLLTPSP